MTNTTPQNGTSKQTKRDHRYWLREPDRFLDVAPHRVASWSVGQGPDLVFIHGWPLHAATFRNIVPALADRFTCHLIDLPGAGRTVSPPDARVSFIGHSDVVRSAIDALGLDRYALVAHDSGGFVARRVAAADARACALVLSDTEIPGHHPWQLAMYLTVLRAPFGAAALSTLMKSRLLRGSALGFGPCFADAAHLDGDFHDLFVKPLIESKSAAEGQLRTMKSLSFGDLDGLAATHAAIKVPVRLIWGEKDSFFPIAKARAMLSQFGGPADLRAIPDGKLFAHEDKAAELVAHAKPFLEEHMSS